MRFMKCLLLLLLMVFAKRIVTGQVLFSMTDCGGAGSLVSTSPNNNQFNVIEHENSPGSQNLLFTNCTFIRLIKNQYNTDKLKIVRTTDLPNFSGVTKTSFAITPIDEPRNGGSIALFWIGNNFSNDYSVPPNEDIGMKIQFTHSNSGEGMKLNGVALNTLFALGARQSYKITVVMNHQNTEVEYDDLQGHTDLLGAKKYRLYTKIGTAEKLIEEGTLGNALMTDLKALFSAPYGIGSNDHCEFKDLVIQNISYTDQTYIHSQQTGPWHSPSTWQGGVVPSSGQNVKITGWHTVTINTEAAFCRNLIIGPTATLTINGQHLTVGNPTGDRRIVEIGYQLALLNGAGLHLNGRLYTTYGSSQLVLSPDATLKINWEGNPPLNTFLVNLDKSNFSLEQGTLYFQKIHPAIGTFKNSRYLGAGTRLIVGDSITTGIGGNVLIEAPGLGNLIINQLGPTGETIVNLKTGMSGSTNTVVIRGSLVNKHSQSKVTAGRLCILGNLSNNGKIEITERFGMGISNYYLGVLGYAIASSPQTISGTGQLIVPELEIANSSSGGVSLSDHFHPQNTSIGHSPFCYLSQGKVFLGNNNLSLYGSTGSAANYFVLNGTGKLSLYHDFINYNRTFHIGTANSYLPLLITGTGTGGGARATFNIGLKTSGLFPYQAPAGGRVDREFEITLVNGLLTSPQLKLQWNNQDEIGTIERTAMYLARHNGSGWVALSVPSTPIGSNPYSLNAVNITDWGTFGVLSNSTPPLCPPTLTPTGNITANQKAATAVITVDGSANTIASGVSVVYQAGSYVQLNPGFRTINGAVFTARILGGCQ